MKLSGCLRHYAIAAALFVFAPCAGCSDTGASAHLDTEAVIRRIKDGALEIGRRHRREPANTQVLIQSLRNRISGYNQELQQCDPSTTQLVKEIVAMLTQLESAKQSPRMLQELIGKLVSVAEALPVESTPASAYDD